MIRPVVVAWALTRVLYLAAAEWSARRVAAGDAPVRYPAEHFWDTLVAWDGLRYLDVAKVLYPATLAEQHGFFPLVPLILRGLDEIGIPPVGGGLVLANLAGLAGLLAVVSVTQYLFGDQVATRPASRWPASRSPTCCRCCTRSRSRWPPASAPWRSRSAAGTGRRCRSASRSACRDRTACCSLPLAGAALRAGGPVVARLFAVAAPAIGLGAFAAYLQARTGSALAFQEAQRKFWFRRSPGLGGREGAGATASRSEKDFVASLSPYLTVGYLAAIIGVARRVPVEWTVFALLTILLPLSTGRYAGIARYGLLALPVFWALAFLGGRYPRLWRVYLVVGPGGRRAPGRVVAARPHALTRNAAAGGVVRLLPVRLPAVSGCAG